MFKYQALQNVQSCMKSLGLIFVIKHIKPTCEYPIYCGLTQNAVTTDQGHLSSHLIMK